MVGKDRAEFNIFQVIANIKGRKWNNFVNAVQSVSSRNQLHRVEISSTIKFKSRHKHHNRRRNTSYIFPQLPSVVIVS